MQGSEFVSRGISFRRRDQNDLPALAILSSHHLCIFAHHRLVLLSFNTMSSIHSDEHDDDDDDDDDVGIKWGRPRYFAPQMSSMQGGVFFCHWNKFWYENGLHRWYPNDKPFQGEIMRSDSAQPGSKEKIMQMKSFTDDEGNPKGIPGYRGLHAILDEISDEKTKVLLSLNNATPRAILKTRVCLLVAENMESSPVPASFERDVASCVLQMATYYAKTQNRRVLKRKASMEAIEAIDGGAICTNSATNAVTLRFGSTKLKITMSDTEACVFFVDWGRFLYKWLFGNLDLNGNRFDGAIMKEKVVYLQFETFTGVNGRPKRIPGFRGLYAILDDLSKDGIAAQLASEECLEGIEHMRTALWLAEMMQTSPLPTDKQTISRVKNALLLFDETFDWETYFWADFIRHQMVLKALGSQYKLPSDILVYIGNFLLPDKLKSAIAHCIFQIATEVHVDHFDGWYNRYNYDDDNVDDNSYDGYKSFDSYNDTIADQDDTEDHILEIGLDVRYLAPSL